MRKRNIILILMCIYLLALVGCGVGGAGLETRDHHLGREYQAEGEMVNPNPYATISSENTNVPSDQFPHTKAVEIQKAKYKFVVDDGQEHQHNIQFQLPGGAPGQEGPGDEQPTPTEREGAGEQPQERQWAEEQAQPAEPERAEERQPAEPERADEQPEEGQPEFTTPDEEETREDAPAEGINEFESRVIELTNVERRNNGLSDLQAHGDLSNVARTKSNDMQENNYFSHTSPTYGSPFDMIRDFGVSYNAAAENIAQGQQSPEQVVQSWMNSEGHRQNILNGDFTHIGVGYNENGHHWTQMFISQ